MLSIIYLKNVKSHLPSNILLTKNNKKKKKNPLNLVRFNRKLECEDYLYIFNR